ncbi:helix-turn-helix domain-containing protein [Nocardia sp. NBC_01730]|uniref:helix-turn-helix domain-containing protein n=1 Tax=Nocardia sp. NBC_01730 TaxID=2975998 RepID=UPI002E0ED55A|nr:helix-turn-helix domain-containing protein [Nocardia sp. NBC_01730]
MDRNRRRHGRAGALDIHKNTVLYRLQQIEGLLGHPIGDRKLQLEIALRVVAALRRQDPHPSTEVELGLLSGTTPQPRPLAPTTLGHQGRRVSS